MKNASDRTLPFQLFFVLIVICSLQFPALGQTYTWGDTNKNENWSDSGNWSGPLPNVVPGKDCTACSVSVPDVGTGRSPNVDISPLTIQNLTIAGNAEVTMTDGETLNLSGGTSLSGFLFMNNGGGATTTLNINSAYAYSNASPGQLTMQLNSSILGNGTLMNDGTISYGGSSSNHGNIGSGSLTLENTAGNTVISGGQGGSTSILDMCPNENWTNAGNIVAQNGATLNINCGKIAQSGNGEISASNATVNFSGATITGGTLASPSGGSLNADTGSATLENLTNSGTFTVLDAATTFLEGAITNNGSIKLIGTGVGGRLSINSPATLSTTGSGNVLLGGSVADIVGSSTLTNQQTIEGAGTIKVTTLDNQGPGGVIGASTQNGDQTLSLQPGTGEVTNTGTITSLGSGSTMEISGGTVNNAGGTISSGSAGGFARLDNSVTVIGGTLSAPSNYVEGVLTTLDGTTSPITITGPFDVLGTDKTILKGTFNGTGPINVEGCPSQPTLDASGVVTLNVPVVLGNDCNLNLFDGDGKNDVTVNNSISGNGKITTMILIIGPKGEIIAGPFAGTPLIIDSSAELEVHGTLIVDVGVILEINGIWLNLNLTTDALVGGIYIINGTMDLPATHMIKTNGGKLTLNFPGAIMAGGVNALGQLSKNTGTLVLNGGTVLDVVSPFTNTGTITVGAGSVFSAGGSGTSYNQSKGTTTVNGSFAAGNINITGGTLAGKNGSIQGTVTLGNPPGGAIATLILGDNTTHAGALSISQNYNQLATGVMDAQIGGTTAGSQYSQLTVTGAVQLNGTLNIKRINNFHPTVGQTFTIVTSPSGVTGTFSVVNGTSISSTEHFAVSYTATSVILTVESGP